MPTLALPSAAAPTYAAPFFTLRQMARVPVAQATSFALAHPQAAASRSEDRPSRVARRGVTLPLFGLLAAAILGSLLVEPAWPLRAVSAFLWLVVAWRPLAVPLLGLAALVALLANALAPGELWQWLRRWLPLLRKRALMALPAAIGLAAVGYAAGVVEGSGLGRASLIAALHVALSPDFPAIVVLGAVTFGLVMADARGYCATRLGWWWWQRHAPPAGRMVRAGLPVVGVALAAAVIASSLFPAAMQGWTRAEDPDARRYSFYSSFFNFAVSADRIQSMEGYELGKLGLVLAPGREGTIFFDLERTPESTVLLKANFYNRIFDGGAEAPDLRFQNAIEISTDGGRTYHAVLRDASVGEVVGTPPLDLTSHLASARKYTLRLWAHNTTPSPVTVLPSVVVTTVTDPLAVPDASFPVVVYAIGLAVIIYGVGHLYGLRKRTAFMLAFTATLCIVTGARVASISGDVSTSLGSTAESVAIWWRFGAAASALLTMRLALVVALVLLIASAVLKSPVGRSSRPQWLAVACLLVTIIAVDARWDHLMRVRYEFLLPDAQGYQSIAESFPIKLARFEPQQPNPAGAQSSRFNLLQELYAAGFDGRVNVLAVFYAGGHNGREPLWPAVLRLVYNVIEPSAFHTRLTSLGFGVAVAGLTCWLAWRMVHPAAGALAGLIVALNRPHIVNSVSGLREELVTALLLLLIGVLFAGVCRGRAPSWWRLTAAGAIAGGVVLVRADMIVLAGGLITAAALYWRWRWRDWIAAGAIAAVLAGPMYVGYAFTHGDPFYPGTYGATVNRNLEFPERMGTPGFPSPEEYAANWAAGPKISAMTYFFGYHTVPQFVEYSIRGFIRIFPTILFEQQPVMLRLFLFGTGMMIVTRRWFALFMLVAMLAPFYAFLAGVPNPWVFPGRYAHHALPYAAMAAAYGIAFVPVWLVSRWRARAGRNGRAPLTLASA
jgi:hypothetical protein